LHRLRADAFHFYHLDAKKTFQAQPDNVLIDEGWGENQEFARLSGDDADDFSVFFQAFGEPLVSKPC